MPLELKMSDLNSDGCPRFILCPRCDTHIPNSSWNHHSKMCKVNRKNYVPVTRYHPTRADDKPKKLSNLYGKRL